MILETILKLVQGVIGLRDRSAEKRKATFDTMVFPVFECARVITEDAIAFYRAYDAVLKEAFAMTNRREGSEQVLEYLRSKRVELSNQRDEMVLARIALEKQAGALQGASLFNEFEVDIWVSEMAAGIKQLFRDPNVGFGSRPRSLIDVFNVLTDPQYTTTIEEVAARAGGSSAIIEATERDWALISTHFECVKIFANTGQLPIHPHIQVERVP